MMSGCAQTQRFKHSPLYTVVNYSHKQVRFRSRLNLSPHVHHKFRCCWSLFAHSHTETETSYERVLFPACYKTRSKMYIRLGLSTSKWNFSLWRMTSTTPDLRLCLFVASTHHRHFDNKKFILLGAISASNLLGAIYTVAQKSMPLSNYEEIVSNGIEVCQ